MKNKQVPMFSKTLFLDITRPYNFLKSEKLLKFYQWKSKANSKALKFNRQPSKVEKKITVNGQSYHPTETLSRLRQKKWLMEQSS